MLHWISTHFMDLVNDLIKVMQAKCSTSCKRSKWLAVSCRKFGRVVVNNETDSWGQTSRKEQQKHGTFLVVFLRGINRPVAGVHRFPLQAANLLAQSSQSFWPFAHHVIATLLTRKNSSTNGKEHLDSLSRRKGQRFALWARDFLCRQSSITASFVKYDENKNTEKIAWVGPTGWSVLLLHLRNGALPVVWSASLSICENDHSITNS